MKYLYVLVGSKNGFYCEQTLVSMASLKNVQPDAFVTLLVDCLTDKGFISELERIKKYVNEYIVVPVEESVPAIARSRYIKTSMRKYVEGDFLYVDADTVWNAPVVETDFTHDVMGVLDGHCLLAEHPLKKGIEEDFKKTDCNPNVNGYVNSGVLFSRDSSFSKSFFKIWHELWLNTSKHGYFIDQPSLNYVIAQMGEGFSTLPNSYNVQISRSWEFFFEAKIIHFYTGWQQNLFESPYLFQQKDFWEKIKQNGITPFVRNLIENPIKAFEKKWNVYGSSENKFRQTALYGFLVDIYSNREKKITFCLLEKMLCLLINFAKKIKR